MAAQKSRDGLLPKNIIGIRMRLARRQQQPKVTQADLAARIAAYGVHLDRLGIGRIETGKRIVLDFEVRAIAAALYVPVSWLLSEDEVWGSLEEVPEPPKNPPASQHNRTG